MNGARQRSEKPTEDANDSQAKEVIAWRSGRTTGNFTILAVSVLIAYNQANDEASLKDRCSQQRSGSL